MGVPSIGSQAKLALDAVLPFDGSSEPFEFISESVKMTQDVIAPPGIRGTRSRNSSRVRKGVERVGGQITLHPNVYELDLLLPRILGGATAGGVTKVAETLPEFQLMVDRVAKVFTYAACRIARATFRGSPGDYLELTLDIEGETESVGAAGSFPAISPNTATRAWIFNDVDFTFAHDASATQVLSFELVIDNVLATDRFHAGSLVRAEIPALDRMVTLGVTLPYTPDEVDLHDLAETGAAGTMSWNDKSTGGSSDYTIDFANLKAPTDSPVVVGKDEIGITLQFQAFKVGNVAGTTDEIMFTKV